ncbi:hypothetical protein LMG23994_02210 [Cupriavidus pinatubonensis]|uniref:Uncharacterized protein n=1 Tax=Cupriavidus pinatubonensis TaxID=248026 RepID=A0ABM8WVX9_9BURK|nr:hypothetical protein LMG23994_02210 [Cupriavidus pinatubonensis]
MPTYEEGRLAAIAVRLALSSGLPAARARAALELASSMISDQEAAASSQNKVPCASSSATVVQLGGTRKRDVSSSNRL